MLKKELSIIGILLVILVMGNSCIPISGANKTVRSYPTPQLEFPVYQSLDEFFSIPTNWEENDELQVTLEVHWVVIDYPDEKVNLGVTVRFYNPGSEILYIKKPTSIRPDYHTNLRAIFSSCPFQVADEVFVTIIPDPLYDLGKDQFVSIDPNDYYGFTKSVEIRLISQLPNEESLENCRVLLKYDNIYIGYWIEPEDWIPERDIRKATSHLTPAEYYDWEFENNLYVDLNAFTGWVTSNTVFIEEFVVMNE